MIMQNIVVIGSVSTNYILQSWLRRCNVIPTLYIELEVEDISNFTVTCKQLKSRIPIFGTTIAVGPLAQRMCKIMELRHLALPATDCKNKELIRVALNNVTRSFYGSNPSIS